MQEVKNYWKVKKDSLKRSLSIKGGVLIEIKVICSPLSKPIVLNSDIRLENIGTVYLTRYPYILLTYLSKTYTVAYSNFFKYIQ